MPLQRMQAMDRHCGPQFWIFQLGRGISAIASYVAITSIEKLEGLLIFRDFDKEVFTQGPLEGATLLLRKLRGESIDSQAIEEKTQALTTVPRSLHVSTTSSTVR